jgi:hypothetical protein
MKFDKLKLNKQLLIKVGCLLLLIAVAPFAIEFLPIADLLGVEFAATFMLLHFRTAFFEFV